LVYFIDFLFFSVELVFDIEQFLFDGLDEWFLIGLLWLVAFCGL
jgi:hypothetical protein